MVVGAGLSFAGAQKSADAAEKAGKLQKRAADMAARNTELQNNESINRERINKRRKLARLRADQGASGVLMDGSAMDVFAETAGNMELGIQDQARAGNMEAAGMRDQGSMSLWEAKTQAVGMRIGSYGNLLSDVGKMAGKV